MKAFLRKHYVLSSLLAALALGMAAGTFLAAWNGPPDGSMRSPADAWVALLAYLAGAAPVFGLFFCYPLVLTGIELYLLLRRPDTALARPERVFDGLILFLGPVYSFLYLGLTRDVVLSADWWVTLTNSETHTPVATWHLPTVAVLALVGLVGYLVLTGVPLAKLPPLVTVCSMAGMYLGCGEGVLWGVQVVTPPFQASWWLGLLPLNLLLITARTVRRKCAEWTALGREPKAHASPPLRWADKILWKSKLWPVLAFALMWPLLGALIGLLALLGQSPSAAIRAWTETSDWNLSRRAAPQNVYYDEHYLCTVAAGGHRRLVRPLRMGVRHGHPVIVNRQLCVANAFEQVLEERTPRLHQAVRGFYDKYGFPVARLIRSPYTADLIYLLMKPLEWLFLLVLYTFDVHPEDRIAVQYTGKSLRDFTADGVAPR